MFTGTFGGKQSRAKAKSTVYFNGLSSFIDFGSHASIDDLNSADFTFEMWFRQNEIINGHWPPINNVIDKNLGGELAGFGFEITEGYLYSFVPHSIRSASENGRNPMPPMDEWSHLAMVFDSSEKAVHGVINSVWHSSTWWYNLGQGDPLSDSGVSLVAGCFYKNYIINSVTHLLAHRYWAHGDMAWMRLSNIMRYTPGQSFTIPSLTVPPAIDANTVEQWNFNEGSGNICHAEVNPANDSKVFTNMRWSNIYRINYE